MNNPLISIIVPVYNVELFLSRCVDSIIAQSYKNTEIILVDDGSKDNCPLMCDDYAVKDSRIKVIHKKNGGLSDARNAGLDVVTGDYIAFVDSDDFVDPFFIQHLLSVLIMNNADIVLCNFASVDENGLKIEKNLNNLSIPNNTIWDEVDFWKAYYSGNSSCTVAWSKLYKSSIFNDIRFSVGKINEDEFILHHVISRCKKIATVHDVLYFYTQRNTSIMGNLKTSINFDVLEAFEERYKYFLIKKYYIFAEQTLRCMYVILSEQKKKAKKIININYNLIKIFSKKEINYKHSFLFYIDFLSFNIGIGLYDFVHFISVKLKYLFRLKKFSK